MTFGTNHGQIQNKKNHKPLFLKCLWFFQAEK